MIYAQCRKCGLPVIIAKGAIRTMTVLCHRHSVEERTIRRMVGNG